MKINDRIILYMDGQMSESEKEAFEEQLLKYPELLDELNSYKNMLGNLDELKDIPVYQGYFSDKIPQVKEKYEKQSSIKLYPRLALGVTTVIAFIFAFLMTVNQPNKNNTQIAQNNLFDNSTIESINNYLALLNNDYNYNDLIDSNATEYDSLLSSMIADELNDNSSISYIQTSSNSDISSMVQSLNTKEADEIYNKILHKKFF